MSPLLENSIVMIQDLKLQAFSSFSRKGPWQSCATSAECTLPPKLLSTFSELAVPPRKPPSNYSTFSAFIPLFVLGFDEIWNSCLWKGYNFVISIVQCMMCRRWEVWVWLSVNLYGSHAGICTNVSSSFRHMWLTGMCANVLPYTICHMAYFAYTCL